MFQHLVVPLDGSVLAEAALPAAAWLARVLGARVTLMHIIEQDAPGEVHGDRHLVEAVEAQAYLDEVAERFFPPGVTVDRHVHRAGVQDVARTIVAHIEELAPDLIVMCTHGRGGVRSWLFGSIAQQVVALGTLPVLLIRPVAAGAEPAPAFRCGRFLVPLDGDPEHERGLSVATGLARACGAALHLVRVVPTRQTLSTQRAATARFLPGTTSALLEMALDKAAAYLDGQLQHIADQEIPVTAEVLRGDPATAIAQAVRRSAADLIVLATHRKKGAEAFWSESVAPKVSNRSRRPLLLVPLWQRGDR